MRHLSFFISKNKKKWFSIMDKCLREARTFDDEKEVIIIRNFFIHDNIDIEKYNANKNWETSYLSLERKDDDLNICSKTYRQFFSDGKGNRTLNNEELGFNHWFYLAYPDVAKWFEDNYDDVKTLLTFGRAISNDYHYYHLEILRNVIEMYKKKYGRLECQT